MRRKQTPKPDVILSEKFSGSDGLMRAISNAATKLLIEGTSIDMCGVSGRLRLELDGGSYELKIETR